MQMENATIGFTACSYLMGNGGGVCKRRQQRFYFSSFPFAFTYLHPFLTVLPQLRARRRQRRCEILFSFFLCVSGVCPFKIHPCEVLQIRNRCSTPPSPRPGLRLSGERESVFLGCGWKARREELIVVGGTVGSQRLSHRETCSN